MTHGKLTRCYSRAGGRSHMLTMPPLGWRSPSTERTVHRERCTESQWLRAVRENGEQSPAQCSRRGEQKHVFADVPMYFSWMNSCLYFLHVSVWKQTALRQCAQTGILDRREVREVCIVQIGVCLIACVLSIACVCNCQRSPGFAITCDLEKCVCVCWTSAAEFEAVRRQRPTGELTLRQSEVRRVQRERERASNENV